MDNVFAVFLQSAGLYEKISIEENNISDLIELLEGNVKISAYCKCCKNERVFVMKPINFYYQEGPDIICSSLAGAVKKLQKGCFSTEARASQGNESAPWNWQNWQIADDARLLKFEYSCAMDKEHHLDYIVLTTPDSMIKIGQYPSIADMTFPELEDYKHVISEQDRKELGTATGLFANGVGAGSYVYLRRILERLVYRAKENAGESIDNKEFQNAKVADKIRMLKGFLPDALVQNATIYGILSKGIHELSEGDCIKYFPIVKECIFMILGMWENLRKKQADEDALNRALNAITSSI